MLFFAYLRASSPRDGTFAMNERLGFSNYDKNRHTDPNEIAFELKSICVIAFPLYSRCRQKRDAAKGCICDDVFIHPDTMVPPRKLTVHVY